MGLQMVLREELYRFVWSKPMTKFAVRFEVSGSYLPRMCTLLGFRGSSKAIGQNWVLAKRCCSHHFPQLNAPDFRAAFL